MGRKKKTWKSKLSILLVTAIVLVMWSTPVFARTDGWFYNQLNATEKQYFDSMDKSGGDFRSGDTTVSVSGTDSISQKNVLNRVLMAFLFDNQDIFWINRYYSISGPITGTYFELKLNKKIDWASGERNLASDIAKLKSDVKSIAAEANKKSTTRDKLAYVHDWLTSHNLYNTVAASTENYDIYTSAIAWTPLSALFQGEKPVCEGYSRAFKLICDELNIPCIIVGGWASDGSKSEGHMWNYVEIDKKWYAVDVTWDDPLVAGKNSLVSGYENKDYFLVGSNTQIKKVVSGKTRSIAFGQSHVPDKEEDIGGFNYPTLSKEAYSGGGDTPTPTPAKTVKITGLSIKPSAKSIAKGKTLTLNPVIKNASTATNKELKWTVTKGKAVFVADGKEQKTFTGEGSCTLKCTDAGDITVQVEALDGSKKKASVKITGPKAPTGISIKKPSVKALSRGASANLTASVKPLGTAVYDKVEWKVLKGQASVVSTGKDTAKVTASANAIGDITVQASVKAGNSTKKATYKFTGPKAASSIKITGKKSIEYQKSLALTAKVSPLNTAVYDEVEWTLTGAGKFKESGTNKYTSPAGKDTVNVICTGGGNIKVTAKVKKAKGYAKNTLTIKGPSEVKSIKIQKPKGKNISKLSTGDSFKLSAKTNPAANKVINGTLVWTSSDEKVATVDKATGQVTCVGKGTATIYASTATGKKVSGNIKLKVVK